MFEVSHRICHTWVTVWNSRVERLAGNNKILYKSVIFWELFLELFHDARNDEYKIQGVGVGSRLPQKLRINREHCANLLCCDGYLETGFTLQW
jgi:hypothetical protein